MTNYKLVDDDHGFRNNARRELLFTGYVKDGKPLSGFYGLLKYQIRDGEHVEEVGKFSEIAVL